MKNAKQARWEVNKKKENQATTGLRLEKKLKKKQNKKIKQNSVEKKRILEKRIIEQAMYEDNHAWKISMTQYGKLSKDSKKDILIEKLLEAENEGTRWIKSGRVHWKGHIAENYKDD